jgi:hypothetical protein
LLVWLLWVLLRLLAGERLLVLRELLEGLAGLALVGREQLWVPHGGGVERDTTKRRAGKGLRLGLCRLFYIGIVVSI